MGWGEPNVTESSQQTGMDTWKAKVTTNTTGEVQELDTESRLEWNRKLLEC